MTPACTGSLTTRSAASGTLPAIFRLITTSPCWRTSRTALSMSPPISDPASTSALARGRRAKALVLAGSLMGGDIESAVREVRQQGLVVISLNMAGSVPDAADLVVSDPVQAGVMAVMIVADTATFTLERLKRRVF